MTVDLLIRQALLVDVPEIVALWNTLQEASAQYETRLKSNERAAEWFAKHVIEQLDNTDAAIFVALQSDFIVGYIFGRIHRRPTLVTGDCGYIADLCVGDGYRGRGIGRKLFETLQLWFRARGLQAIEVQVVRANPASQAFWRKMGFSDFLRTLRKE